MLKSFVFIIALFLTIREFSQLPEFNVDDTKIKKLKIKTLTILLDLSASNYKLPFKIIHYRSFHKNGKILFKYRIMSDVVYVKTTTLYEYKNGLNIKEIEIDSSFKGNDCPICGIDTSYIIKEYENSLLKKVEYFPWSNLNKLEKINYYFYDSNGRIISTKEIYENSEENEAIIVYDETENITQTIYKRNKKEIRKNMYIYDKDGFKTQSISYYCEKINKKVNYKYDSSGNFIEKKYYDRDEKLLNIEKFKFNQNNLLIEEISYNKIGGFEYRFITIYTYY